MFKLAIGSQASQGGFFSTATELFRKELVTKGDATLGDVFTHLSFKRAASAQLHPVVLVFTPGGSTEYTTPSKWCFQFYSTGENLFLLHCGYFALQLSSGELFLIYFGICEKRNSLWDQYLCFECIHFVILT